MDFLNISGETEIYRNLQNIRQENFHITEKLWECQKHIQIMGFLTYFWWNKITCILQIMETIISRLMGKVWESSNYFQMLFSLQYFS